MDEMLASESKEESFSWTRAFKHAGAAFSIVFALGMVATAFMPTPNLPTDEVFIRGTQIGHLIGKVGMWTAFLTFLASCLVQNGKQRVVMILGVGLLVLTLAFVALVLMSATQAHR